MGSLHTIPQAYSAFLRLNMGSHQLCLLSAKLKTGKVTTAKSKRPRLAIYEFVSCSTNIPRGLSA